MERSVVKSRITSTMVKLNDESNEDCSNESDAEPDAESDDEDGQESSAQPQHEEKTPDTGNNWLKQPVTRISLLLRQENAGKPNLKRGKIRNKA